MIKVTRLNGKEFTLNADLIETMEETPDTVITLTGGNKYVVAESTEELIRRIADFRQRCHPYFREGSNRQEERSGE